MYSAGSLQTFQTSVGELAATNVAYNYMGHTAERNAASSKRVIYVINSQTTISNIYLYMSIDIFV